MGMNHELTKYCAVIWVMLMKSKVNVKTFLFFMNLKQKNEVIGTVLLPKYCMYVSTTAAKELEVKYINIILLI